MRALVFGARGQIGRFLLPRLQQAGWTTTALTRAEPPRDDERTTWRRFDLGVDRELDLRVDVIFSLGPLDAFASWFGRHGPGAVRVIAFGSTSVHTKADSPDPHERDLAARLAAAETQLQAASEQRDARLTLLRPTLIYGAGLDRNLSRIAALARRWRCFALPRGACGLRQPVHADDLAQAAWQSALLSATPQSHYDLPGGETLAYRDMVRRLLDALRPRARLIEVPAWSFRLALGTMQRFGRLGDASAGVLARLAQDLVFDADAARRDLGYAPRPFVPRAEMFVAEETGALLRRNTI